MNNTEFRWPALPYAQWKDAYATLYRWTQIVGKVRLALSRKSLLGMRAVR
jgi:uncharacterized protein DUF5996